MNPVMCVLGFLGSIVAYCVIALVLSAFISIIATHQSGSYDDDFWSNACFAQFAIALVVLAIYFSNMMFEVS